MSPLLVHDFRNIARHRKQKRAATGESHHGHLKLSLIRESENETDLYIQRQS